MKKSTLLSFLLSFCSIVAMANLPDGSTAPDFTVKDMKGNMHHLYKYLDEGKYVVVDMFKTYCLPCIQIHDSHVMDSLYVKHGPQGTNKLTVLAIDVDIYSTDDDLRGTGNNTLGDYTKGTLYPLINTPYHQLHVDYGITYYPTTYLVCPDKRIINLGYPDIATVEQAMGVGCPAPTTNIDAEMLAFTGMNADCNNEVYMSCRFQNMGINDLTSANIHIKDQSNIIKTVAWTGLLKYGQSADFYLGDITHTTKKDYSIEVEVTGDTKSSNNSITTTINKSFANTTNQQYLAFELSNPVNGMDTHFLWDLIDDNLDTTYSGEGWFSITGGTPLYRDTFEVKANTCYRFVIHDPIGITGSYAYMKIEDLNQMTIATQAFNSQVHDTMYFKTGASVGINTTKAVPVVEIYPNPANEQITFKNIALQGSTADYRIVDALGRVVLNEKVSTTTESYILNTQNIPNGSYRIQVITNSTVITLPLIISH